MKQPKIAVILGSIREGRAGEQVANWLLPVLKGAGTAEIELLDLREYPLPMFADPGHPAMRQGAHPNPEVQRWLEKLDAADGFVFVTPEYNHGYSSALKNAIDYGAKEWYGKPLGFVSYGGLAGGARAVEQLRQVAGELRMYDVRDAVVITLVNTAFAADGTLSHEEGHRKNALAMLENVVSLAAKLRV
jgi:NAD(P)H-dependent FMN reductase